MIITPLILRAVYFGMQVSVRLLLTLSAIGVVMIVLDLAILVRGGAEGILWSSLSPFSLSSGGGVSTFLLGVGLAVTCLAVSEGAVFMAEEAREPRRTVPKAIMTTMGWWPSTC